MTVTERAADVKNAADVTGPVAFNVAFSVADDVVVIAERETRAELVTDQILVVLTDTREADEIGEIGSTLTRVVFAAVVLKADVDVVRSAETEIGPWVASVKVGTAMVPVSPDPRGSSSLVLDR